jgi:protein-disulfide isomerase
MRGFFSIIIIIVVIVGAIMFFSRGEASPQTSVDGTTDVGTNNTGLSQTEVDQTKLVGDARNFKGGDNATVTIVEFSDFQCPYCQLASSEVKALSEKYGDKIKIVFRHFALDYHEYAQMAAEATEAAGAQGKFWEMHYKIYDNQDSLSENSFVKFAQELNLDVDKFKQELESGKYTAIVKKDRQDGNDIGVNGTPSFYINNKKANISNFTDLEEIIDQELNK